MAKEYTVEEWKKKLSDIENNHIYEEDRLDLGGKKLDEQKIAELIAALQTNYENHQESKDLHCIRWIDFNDVGLNDHLIEILTNGLQNIANNIDTVNLTGNTIENSNCLIGFLKLNKLTKLSLGYNQISDESLNAFAVTLGDKNCRLKTLDLSYNIIGNASSIKLILEKNTSLEYIDISNNDFTDKTMQYLVEGLNNNKTIKKIDINDCKITDEHIEILVNGIKKTSLEKLYMCDNDGITEKSEGLLQEMSKNNSSMEIYILDGQEISTSAELITNLPNLTLS